MKKLTILITGIFIGVALSAGTVVGATTYLKATQSNVKIVVNDTEAKLSNPPVHVNGKLYLPVRDTANALGYSVQSVTRSAVTLKEGISQNTSAQTNESKTKTNSVKKEYQMVKNLKETYSTDGKLDAAKIKEALNNGTLDVNAQDTDTGNTLLMYVILENNYEAYKSIKHNDLNPNIQNKDKQTALHLTTINKNYFYRGELLDDLKVDASIMDAAGKQAIDYTEEDSTDYFRLYIYMNK
ncbi:stalk domain-containing protein [Paenibacillus apiarius]|uniref:Copper amine oxidase N-terminal domain-containing protein n=1 Tax=Paenibacillus apiarius TaxID=46240 RepID=A0ABT4DPA2_9BACL|nr:stalk domain-containing protein [Paenibacillus apiarius]MCY9517217.1 copper amine oxidase N-terminal domain-containing protein [Paenibacillus apiarius]MCY9519188.1 copper amine oxidase N-terminal domain-containing protein [Paenibacillus apiarius]MCY9551029.1 copper amine oxidase N-terminal domain-containing protein [Paenibacillus apiarius]MCY9560016.1 copper amine oxidase N-terminal domain-containing protein [Paenibacillus apiarius]MCY9683341.1 copper amine oxidase N-terminal domain-contain